MVIRIEMLNGEEDGEEKREEKVSFGGGISAHLAIFFSPACHLTALGFRGPAYCKAGLREG